MAYFVTDPVAVTPGASAASFAVDVSDIVTVANDYVVVCVLCSATTGTITESSGGASTWTLTTLNVASGQRMCLAYTKASGASVSNPTFSGATGMWQAAKFHVRDADATTFADGTITTSDGGNVTSASTGALTPTNDNALVLYFASGRAGGTFNTRFLPDDVVGQITQRFDDSTVFTTLIVGTVQQTTKAATAKTYYHGVGASRSGSIVLAIKNKTSGKLYKHGTAGVSRVAWLGDMGNAHDGVLTPTLSSFGVPTSRTISGVTVNSTTAGTRTRGVQGPRDWGTYDEIICAVNANNWQGGMLTFAADIDFTGKLFSVEFFSNNLGLPVGDKGLALVFEDNAGTNWKCFQLSAKLGFKTSELQTAMIDLDNATPYDSGGTLSSASVRKISCLMHRAGTSASGRNMYFRNMLLLDKATLVGGNSATPLDITFLDKVCGGWGYSGLCDKQGPAVMAKYNVQIGDGSFPTYFDASATMLSHDVAYSVVSQRLLQVGASRITQTIKASSTDTIYDRASANSAGQLQNYTLDSATSTSAAYSFAGKTIVRETVTWKTGIPCASATFSSCAPIDFKGADVTDCSISATTASASQAAAKWDTSGATVTRTTIDVTGTSAGYHIELGTSVTAITLADVTFSGTPGTDKVHVKATTGTVTITTSGSTSLLAADVTSDGATVVISAPATYQSVVINNLVVGSRVQIYDTTNSVELANEVAAGTTVTWTDSVAYVADRDIRVRIAYVSGVTAKHFVEAAIGTVGDGTPNSETLTYRANQSDDDVYVANAIDGSAVTGITFTDSTIDTVNINIVSGSVTYPQIYAAAAYWLSTVVGITDDIAMVDAPDPANYKFTAMKIKNTGTGVLSITGGYGYDATTLSVADIIDTTGGFVFPLPDHVVAYATGSALTAGQAAQLSAISTATADIAGDILTAAPTTPIHADVRKVTGVTVTGTGTEADPWGP